MRRLPISHSSWESIKKISKKSPLARVLFIGIIASYLFVYHLIRWSAAYSIYFGMRAGRTAWNAAGCLGDAASRTVVHANEHLELVKTKFINLPDLPLRVYRSVAESIYAVRSDYRARNSFDVSGPAFILRFEACVLAICMIFAGSLSDFYASSRVQSSDLDLLSVNIENSFGTEYEQIAPFVISIDNKSDTTLRSVVIDSDTSGMFCTVPNANVDESGKKLTMPEEFTVAPYEKKTAFAGIMADGGTIKVTGNSVSIIEKEIEVTPSEPVTPDEPQAADPAGGDKEAADGVDSATQNGAAPAEVQMPATETAPEEVVTPFSVTIEVPRIEKDSEEKTDESEETPEEKTQDESADALSGDELPQNENKTKENIDTETEEDSEDEIQAEEDDEEDPTEETEDTAGDSDVDLGIDMSNSFEDSDIISVVVPTSVSMPGYFTTDGIMMQSENIPIINKSDFPLDVSLVSAKVETHVDDNPIIRMDAAPGEDIAGDEEIQQGLDMHLWVQRNGDFCDYVLPEGETTDVTSFTLDPSYSNIRPEDLEKTDEVPVLANDYATMYLLGEVRTSRLYTMEDVSVNLRFNFSRGIAETAE